MQIINLCPQLVRVRSSNPDGGWVTYQPSGKVASLAVVQGPAIDWLPFKAAWGDSGYDKTVPDYEDGGWRLNLPEQEDGTVYIVPVDVADASPHRHDLFAPVEPVVDDNGVIMGYDRLVSAHSYSAYWCEGWIDDNRNL